MNLLQLLNIMIASFIFFPTQEYTALPANSGLNYENIFITTQDQVKISAWFLQASQSRGTIYLLHGNAGNISDRLFKAEEWVKRGFSVFLLDYRSYGKSEGKITSEKDLYLDAQAGMSWLEKEKKIYRSEIILFGESIGAAPAIDLAVQNAYRGIILEAPFTSISDIAKHHYPMIPSVLLGAFRFDNLAKIPQLKAPLFILHGTSDEICPFEMGKRLFDEAPQPKEFFEISNGTHNELPFQAGEEFYDKPLQFLLKYQS